MYVTTLFYRFLYVTWVANSQVMNQINSSRPDALCMTVRIIFDKRIKQKLSVLSCLGEPL